MRKTNFHKVWDAVQKLTEEELQRLRCMIDILLVHEDKPLTDEAKLDLEMLEDGAIDYAPAVTDRESLKKWKPVEIQGKPISETIIEERR